MSPAYIFLFVAFLLSAIMGMIIIPRILFLSHKHKLNMAANARFTKVNAGNLPRNVFEFMSFKDILISQEEDVVAGMKSYLLDKV